MTIQELLQQIKNDLEKILAAEIRKTPLDQKKILKVQNEIDNLNY